LENDEMKEIWYLIVLVAMLLSPLGNARADFASVSAAGTTQATATVITASDTQVTSATIDQGVILKSVTTGTMQWVTNATSARIKVYPPSGAAINGGSADAAITVQPNSRVSVIAYNATTYAALYTGVASASVETNTNGAGTVTTAATTVATEYGDGVNHVTKLAMTGFAIGTSGDAAAKAIGAKMYTWPSGVDVFVDQVVSDGGVTCAISATTDTPEFGFGTVVASGVTATLSTATWEVFMDGGATRLPTSGGDQVAIAPDVAGTAFRKVSLSTLSPIIKASGGAARDVFMNIAVTWSDVTAVGACTFTGNVWIYWTVIG
jgi:hypothetical protein